MKAARGAQDDAGRVLVLLIEDEDDQAGHLILALRDSGFEVVRAESFAQARSLLVDDELKPDLVVLDLDVRGRDGATLIEQVRARGIAVAPIVIVSGSSAELLEHVCLRIGAAGFVRKPCDLIELERLLRGALPAD
jgi:DNA-binding response OmpR family regulator